MFTIKNLVNKITDKGNGQRPGENSASFVDSDDQHSAEGFLCPACMRAFPSPETLEEHYVTHGEQPPLSASTPEGNGSDIQILRQEIENLQTSLVEEKSMSEELKREVLKIQTEFYKKDEGNTSNVQDLEQTTSLLKSEVTLLRQQLTDELGLTSQLRKDKELLKEKLLSLANENDEIKSENKSLQAQISHRNSIDDAAVLRQELVSVQKMMDDMTKEKEKEIEDIQIKVQDLENDLTETRKINENYEARLAEFETLKDENVQLKTELSESMENHFKKDSEIEHLKGVLQTKETFEQLQTQQAAEIKAKEDEQKQKVLENQEDPEMLKSEVQKFQSQNQELTKQVQNLKLEVESYQSSMKQLTDETASSKRQYKELEELLKKKENEVGQITKTAEDNQNKHQTLLETKGAEINELKQKIKALESDISEQTKRCQTLTEKFASEKANLMSDIESLQSKLSNNQSIIQSLENSKNELEKQVKTNEEKATAEKTALNSELERLKSVLLQNEQSIKTLQHSKDELDKELKIRQENITKLDQELKGTLLKNQETVDVVGKLQESVQKSEELIAKKEETLRTVINETAAKIEKVTQDYESRIQSLDNTITESNAKIDSLTTSLKGKTREYDNVRESLAQTNALLTEKTSKLASLEQELQEIDSTICDLKQKLKSSEEEKALLTERCLADQSKAEESHKAYDECRRKLDDSVSALQELGRENQSLQIEIAKSQGRKWIDDSMVNTCTGCEKEFTLTIRKHHCRSCLQIFCSKCSEKKILLPAHPTPQRVCDHCFQDHSTK